MVALRFATVLSGDGARAGGALYEAWLLAG